jgi:hypothetical protein
MRVHRFFSRLAAVGLVTGVAFSWLPVASSQTGTTGTSAFGSRTLGGATTTANRTGRSAGATNPAAAGASGIGGAAGQAAGPGTSGNSVTGSERYVRDHSSPRHLKCIISANTAFTGINHTFRSLLRFFAENLKNGNCIIIYPVNNAPSHIFIRNSQLMASRTYRRHWS